MGEDYFTNCPYFYEKGNLQGALFRNLSRKSDLLVVFWSVVDEDMKPTLFLVYHYNYSNYIVTTLNNTSTRDSLVFTIKNNVQPQVEILLEINDIFV